MTAIRIARSGDFPAICRLIESSDELYLVHPAGKYPWSVAQLEKLATERFELTVMESVGTIVGFANLYDLEPRQHAFIGNIIITASMRGHAYGRRLIQHMLKRLFQNHRLPEARISVFADNSSAITLYRSLGFLPYAEEQRHASEGSRQLILLRLNNNG